MNTPHFMVGVPVIGLLVPRHGVFAILWWFELPLWNVLSFVGVLVLIGLLVGCRTVIVVGFLPLEFLLGGLVGFLESIHLLIHLGS